MHFTLLAQETVAWLEKQETNYVVIICSDKPGLTMTEQTKISSCRRFFCKQWQINMLFQMCIQHDDLNYFQTLLLTVNQGWKFFVSCSKDRIFRCGLKVWEQTKTRFKQPKLLSVVSRTNRFKNSPISYMTNLLNKEANWISTEIIVEHELLVIMEST